jgi:hypothetical protein
MTKKPNDGYLKNSEFESDAWQRFERAVDVVAKSPPQPKKKTKEKATARKASRRPPVKSKP